jgi:hypothetical protein
VADGEQIEHAFEMLEGVVSYLSMEYEIPTASFIGCLEILKQKLINEALEDE